MSRRNEERLRLGGAAVLSVSYAAEMLPVRDGDGRAWLRARGLVRQLNGEDVVVWGDVLDALRGDQAAPRVRAPKLKLVR